MDSFVYYLFVADAVIMWEIKFVEMYAERG